MSPTRPGDRCRPQWASAARRGRKAPPSARAERSCPPRRGRRPYLRTTVAGVPSAAPGLRRWRLRPRRPTGSRGRVVSLAIPYHDLACEGPPKLRCPPVRGKSRSCPLVATRDKICPMTPEFGWEELLDFVRG